MRCSERCIRSCCSFLASTGVLLKTDKACVADESWKRCISVCAGRCTRKQCRLSVRAMSYANETSEWAEVDRRPTALNLKHKHKLETS